MMTLRTFQKGLTSVPLATAWSLTELGQAMGRQELFTRQSPQRLRVLREHALDEFRLSDIERACPGVGREWIRTLLAEMREAGEVTCRGRGPGARWRWLGSKGSTLK